MITEVHMEWVKILAGAFLFWCFVMVMFAPMYIEADRPIRAGIITGMVSAIIITAIFVVIIG